MAIDNHFDGPHSEPTWENADKQQKATVIPPLALKLLEDFGLHFNLPDLAFDDHGICLINLDEHLVTIALDRTGNSLVLSCEVIDIPSNADERFFARLLVGNFSTTFARMGSLAIDSARGKVILLQRLPLLGLFPEELGNAIERIANGAAIWQQELANNNASNAP